MHGENTGWYTTRQKATKEIGYFRVPQLLGSVMTGRFLIVNLEGGADVSYTHLRAHET